jgi:hypothetical protein
VLDRQRLNQLFSLRAAAKAAEREADAEFLDRYKFDPCDQEAVAVAGRRWVADAWSELRDVKSAILAYEEADRTLSAEERTALVGMIELEWKYDDAPRLDLLLDLLEARQRHGTH